MKRFNEFNIKPTSNFLMGEKINIKKILNREITVHEFKVAESKYGEGKKCLHLQISLNGTKHVVFIGSKNLIETIQQVSTSDFPFITTIVVENERPEFT